CRFSPFCSQSFVDRAHHSADFCDPAHLVFLATLASSAGSSPHRLRQKSQHPFHLRFAHHAVERPNHPGVRNLPPPALDVRNRAPWRSFRSTQCLQQRRHWLPGLACLTLLHHRYDHALLSPLSWLVEHVSI